MAGREGLVDTAVKTSRSGTHTCTRTYRRTLCQIINYLVLCCIVFIVSPSSTLFAPTPFPLSPIPFPHINSISLTLSPSFLFSHSLSFTFRSLTLSVTLTLKLPLHRHRIPPKMSCEASRRTEGELRHDRKRQRRYRNSIPLR